MKRAEELLKTGRVRGLSSRQSAELLSGGGREGYRMLDVRPAWEWERAHIPDALHVPLFVEDDSTGPLALLRKQIQFGFGGWWLGQRLTKRNADFLRQVQEVAPDRNAALLVACGEGLRRAP
eukprot:SM000053S17394  [mRNA]  locus=s53:110653:111395:+ [translate_table: standard]